MKARILDFAFVVAMGAYLGYLVALTFFA